MITATAQKPSTDARRPLPKPPKGSRGFEQYEGKDASTRLIGMGATREVITPRKPYAPLLGLAYNPRPFFAWAPAFGTKSYRFVLYENDVYANPSSRVVFETDVAATEFAYPADKPALTPGKLYSWRVSTEGGKEVGPPVALFVLAGRDAAELKAALGGDPASTPVSETTRIKQMGILREYGVWYDALQIASEIAAGKPDDEAAQRQYESLLDAIDTKKLPDASAVK